MGLGGEHGGVGRSLQLHASFERAAGIEPSAPPLPDGDADECSMSWHWVTAEEAPDEAALVAGTRAILLGSSNVVLCEPSPLPSETATTFTPDAPRIGPTG